MQWYSLSAMLQRGRGTYLEGRQILRGVTKLIASRSGLESRTAEGNGPVRESNQPPGRHPSSAGSGKAGVNLRRPLRKAKYKLATDSARVP